MCVVRVDAFEKNLRKLNLSVDRLVAGLNVNKEQF